MDMKEPIFHDNSQAIPYPAIPLNAGHVQGWKNIPIKKDAQPDPLVPLGLLSQQADTVTTSSLYFGEHSNSPYADHKNTLEGSLLTLFARQSVARRLVAAEHLLPTGHHLLIFDAYRPYQVQKSLYDFYKRKLSEKYPAMNNEALDFETQKYVSLPSTNLTRPSPHNTGGAVDVAIVKLKQPHEEELLQIRSRLAGDTLNFEKQADLEMQAAAIMRCHSIMLNFGTAFDHGGEKSALAYYESMTTTGETLTKDDLLARSNRRLLFRVMTRVGFQPYFAEWWHFNAPESQMGATTAGLGYATFGAAMLDKDNVAHEHTRRAIYKTDDSTLAKNWPAEIIAPPEK